MEDEQEKPVKKSWVQLIRESNARRDASGEPRKEKMLPPNLVEIPGPRGGIKLRNTETGEVKPATAADRIKYNLNTQKKRRNLKKKP